MNDQYSTYQQYSFMLESQRKWSQRKELTKQLLLNILFPTYLMIDFFALPYKMEYLYGHNHKVHSLTWTIIV